MSAAQQIREAIAASPTIRAMYPDTAAMAAALSAGRTRLVSRMVSARGLAERYPGGPLGAEVVLMKLEGAAATMKASEDQQQKVLGSLIARQLGFLSGEGLDFGSPALRAMLQQFSALGILSAEEVDGLLSIGVAPDPYTARDIEVAIFADDGALLI